eukprot:jgi/Mesvir1/15899/Mv02802-RA.1
MYRLPSEVAAPASGRLAVYSLYASHALSRWANRMWEFAVPMLFLAVWTDSLLLPAVFGAVEAVFNIAAGAPVGRWVNDSPRLQVVTLTIGIQKLSLFVSAAAMGLLVRAEGEGGGGGASSNLSGMAGNLTAGLSNVTQGNSSQAHTPYSNISNITDSHGIGPGMAAIPSTTMLWGAPLHNVPLWLAIVLVVTVNLLGGVAAVSSMARAVAIEKDWVVVIAQALASASSNDADADDEPMGAPPGPSKHVGGEEEVELRPGRERRGGEESDDGDDGDKCALAKAGSKATVGDAFSVQLAKLNSVVMRIDLTCLILAPVLAGWVLSYSASPFAAILFMAAWNLVSWLFEWWLLRAVYAAFPPLASRGAAAAEQAPLASHENAEPNGGADGDADALSAPSGLGAWRPVRAALEYASSLWSGWQQYARQPALLAALALAFLYLTVLSFGTLMSGYLRWWGVTPLVISLARGLGAAMGVLATLIYPIAHGLFRPERAGLHGIMLQWSMLLLCVMSLLVADNRIACGMLMGGVALSRFGLWLFDLACMHVLQESLAEEVRGTVGGVQASLQELMNLLGLSLGMIFHNPEDFWLLVLISFGMVSSGAALYASYCYKVRGHLIHCLPCAKSHGRAAVSELH